MRKGFIFTIDALMAIALIVAVGTALFFVVQKPDSELSSLQALRIAQDDNAMVGFYLGKADATTGEITTNVPQFLQDSKIAYCSSSYYYNISSGLVVQRNYCGGKQ